VERLFRVKRGRAIQLMKEFGGTKGDLLSVDRDLILLRIRESRQAGELGNEERRKAKLEEDLATLAKYRSLPFAEHPVPARASTWGARLENLPASIKLVPGHFSIDFTTPDDFLAKHFLFAQILGNDLDRVIEMMDPLRPPAPHPESWQLPAEKHAFLAHLDYYSAYHGYPAREWFSRLKAIIRLRQCERKLDPERLPE
jgi:hypothetical protein